MTNVNVEAARVLREAAQVIQEKGIAKKTLEDEQGRVCMWGAINTAFTGEAVIRSHSKREAVKGVKDSIRYLFNLKFIDEDHPPVSYPGAEWNDEPNTTSTDVAKFFLKTADEIEVS